MPRAVGAGQGPGSGPHVPPPACASGLAHASRARGWRSGVLLRGLGCGGVGLAFSPPQTAFGDERSTSQGSQPPPPGSPLSREEGEAPPLVPPEEGRRRSRRVRLRGSCRHRPSLLSRRELASSVPAVPATASSEVSLPGTMGEGFVGPEQPYGLGLLPPELPKAGVATLRAPVDRAPVGKRGECLLAPPEGLERS